MFVYGKNIKMFFEVNNSALTLNLYMKGKDILAIFLYSINFKNCFFLPRFPLSLFLSYFQCILMGRERREWNKSTKIAFYNIWISIIILLTQKRSTNIFRNLISRPTGFRKMAEFLIEHAFELKKTNKIN